MYKQKYNGNVFSRFKEAILLPRSGSEVMTHYYSSTSDGSELKHILQLHSLGFSVLVVSTCRAALQKTKIV